MKNILLFIAVALLAGCASVVKVEGDQVVADRLNVKVGEAWNKMPYSHGPFETWTREGPNLDQLRFWAGIKSGQALAKEQRVPSGQTAPRVPTYTSGMAADQLVNLFETMYASDGSLVKVVRTESSTFAGAPGWRFEFTITRKGDDLLMRGVGWVSVRNNELFAATFTAPQLTFFPRLVPKVESVVASARIKG
ncbi:hypothetical protein FN976_08110 [Caenimonas sedimenti]|uniref:DUF1795 domain-containing protein n=1 Tax=Caenimonas sedimenti TaxID=2596921 RepID=A0A562ZTK8_9BURK|nr:hypothetical protein [Caenimonas sedimenti]TWO71942.1 hypothetical protein FN976_08110 [Caenimonas sedimenti]